MSFPVKGLAYIECLGPSKVKGMEELSSEQEDEKQDQTRKEQTLATQKVAQSYEKYVKNYNYVTMKSAC